MATGALSVLYPLDYWCIYHHSEGVVLDMLELIITNLVVIYISLVIAAYFCPTSSIPTCLKSTNPQRAIRRLMPQMAKTQESQNSSNF